MHHNSQVNMQKMIDQYLKKDAPGDVLEVGGSTLAGSYKQMLLPYTKTYTCAELAIGPNVDVVLKGEFDWSNLPQEYYDTFVCGQVLEHVRNPFKFVACINQVCKVEALAFVIAPWQWNIHRFPVDCWRILPDGMLYLMEESGFERLECYQSESDTVFVGRKLPKKAS